MTEVSKSLPSCLPQISSPCYLPENNHFINNLFRKKGGRGKPLLGNYISLGTDFRGSKNPPASQANQKNPNHPVPFLTSHNATGLDMVLHMAAHQPPPPPALPTFESAWMPGMELVATKHTTQKYQTLGAASSAGVWAK